MNNKISNFARRFTDSALRFDCDKVIDHDYAIFYAQIFTSIKSRNPVLLEIGAGGYADPMSGGASARVWSEILPNWSIVILDLEAKSFTWPERTTFYQADQTDLAALEHICQQHGPFDVIIDDGSHQNEHIRKSLVALFPHLKDSGHYIIEDTQTSYLAEYGGSLDRHSSTTANLVRDLFDWTNAAELPADVQMPAVFQDTVEEVRFRHNIIDIQKRTDRRYSNLSSAGLTRMMARAEKLLDPLTHGPGYFLRRARYLARLDQIVPAIETLAHGQEQWPDDLEITAALAWLLQTQKDRSDLGA